MVTVVNTKTGEIFEQDIPFRTITNLKGYHDGEVYKKGSSAVDLTGYEPLSSIIARCTRVMRAPGGQTYQVLDTNALKAEQTFADPVFEASGASSIDEAFVKATDITETPGFDLSDAGRILAQAKDLSTSTTASSSSKASEPELVVDKSEDEPKIEVEDEKQTLD